MKTKLITIIVTLLLIAKFSQTMNQEGDRRIQVILPFQNTLSISINQNTTFEELKRMIFSLCENYEDYTAVCGAATINWHIFHEGEKKEIMQFIRDYNVIQLIMRMPGGGAQCKFFDYENSSNKNTKIGNWSCSAQPWRVHMRGANLIGICENSTCKASGKRVISGLGYGTFYVIRNSEFVADSKCPICSRYIVPKTTSFNNCFFKILGKKSENRMKWESEWHRIDDRYLIHEESENTANWSILRIDCRELNNPPEPEDEI